MGLELSRAASSDAELDADVDAEFRLLRRTEFCRLDAAGQAYLDYTGAALYTASQIDAYHDRLLGDVLGNPHSESPASTTSTARMERTRSRLLDFFHASPDEYDVVFTANASAALRIVGESFPFASGSRFVLTADNHNSVNGIRCFAERAGAAVRYVPLGAELRSATPWPWLPRHDARSPSLLAFPAQSNFSGVRHPLEWVAEARARGYHVLLDAAAFVPTAELRLDDVQPDFVPVSFYKMFGFPTGVGALVVRRQALALLRRAWFAGGTIAWVSTQDMAHTLRPGAAAFEDGTPNFLAFDAVHDGLEWLGGIGVERVGARVLSLTGMLLDRLHGLVHPNGRPMVTIHGPRTLDRRGAIVAFSVLDAAGAAVPFAEVVKRAGRHGVSVRGGCFCNPGCVEAAFRFSAERARVCRTGLGAAYTDPLFSSCMRGPVGAVRVSLGVPTVVEDIDRLVDVLSSYRGKRLAEGVRTEASDGAISHSI